jgi:hypothetical protein
VGERRFLGLSIAAIVSAVGTITANLTAFWLGGMLGIGLAGRLGVSMTVLAAVVGMAFMLVTGLVAGSVVKGGPWAREVMVGALVAGAFFAAIALAVSSAALAAGSANASMLASAVLMASAPTLAAVLGFVVSGALARA